MTRESSEQRLTNNELAIKLDDLSQLVRDGFNDMKRRQDLTNGNVLKNTEFRISATATFVTIKWLVGLIGVGTLFNVLYNYGDLFLK